MNERIKRSSRCDNMRDLTNLPEYEAPVLRKVKTAVY